MSAGRKNRRSRASRSSRSSRRGRTTRRPSRRHGNYVAAAHHTARVPSGARRHRGGGRSWQRPSCAAPEHLVPQGPGHHPSGGSVAAPHLLAHRSIAQYARAHVSWRDLSGRVREGSAGLGLEVSEPAGLWGLDQRRADLPHRMPALRVCSSTQGHGGARDEGQAMSVGLWPRPSASAKPIRAMSVIVGIRAAEGGLDAKDLVTEQFSVYARRAARHGL